VLAGAATSVWAIEDLVYVGFAVALVYPSPGAVGHLGGLVRDPSGAATPAR
jgi:hypothetical protein